jgi:hypothetical protein
MDRCEGVVFIAAMKDPHDTVNRLAQLAHLDAI